MTLTNHYISSQLFIELLECVNYLHKQNIIHRYLKSLNILINNGENGRFVKLEDFGLTVIHESNDESHSQNEGTLQYMAPEVVRGTRYNTKADIYSLGAIIQNFMTLMSISKNYTIFNRFHCLINYFLDLLI
jgi:serine/threonine protein kinase